jgi:hypothetical protein
MTLLTRLRHWLAGSARARRLHRLRRRRFARDLPGMYAAAVQARAECEADIGRAKPGLERWRLKCERMTWDSHVGRIRRLTAQLGVSL